MRITVIGVVAVIGAIVLLVFVVDRFVQNSKGKQSGNDEQAINPS